MWESREQVGEQVSAAADPAPAGGEAQMGPRHGPEGVDYMGVGGSDQGERGERGVGFF
jgi:hypothetical protein